MPVENIVSSAPHERGRINASREPVGPAVALERAAPVHRGDDVLDIDKRVETFGSANGLRAGEGKIDRDIKRIYVGDSIDAGAPVEDIVPTETDQQVVAGAAAQSVVAAIPDQRVAKGGADEILDPRQRVCPAPTSRLRAAHTEIDTHGRRRVVIRRRIAADAADQRVVAVSASKQVISGGAVEPVVASEPTKGIVAAASVEVILPRGAGEAIVVVATGEE